MRQFIRIKGSAITKINGMFFLLMVTALAVSVGYYAMYRVIGKQYARSMELHYETAAIKEAMKRCDAAMEDYLITRNRGSLAEHNEAVKEMDLILDACWELVTTPKAASFLQSVSDAFYSYQKAANYGAFSYAEDHGYEGSLSFQESREIEGYIQGYCDEIMALSLEKNKQDYVLLNKTQNQLLFLNLCAVALLAAAACWSVCHVNDTFYYPLHELYNASLKIADGRMVQVREDWQDSVIRTQAAAFNQMSRSIVRMMEDIRKNADIKTELLNEQLKNEQFLHRLEQADFLNLQLQTNPHFLFNTLNTISRTVTLGMKEEAVEMIDAMAALLRYNLNDTEAPVSLGEEIGVVKEYLHIQKFRFRDRLKAGISCPLFLAESVFIPRFSLQPFVENAVLHGLEPKTGPGLVRMIVEQEGESCIVRITDDGVGIDADKLKQLNSGEPVQQGRRKSVGIHNTVERLRFFTKDMEAVTIQSTKGEGTTVTIRLPMGERHV